MQSKLKKVMNKFLLFAALLSSLFLVAQQNDEFKKVKEYYDYQRIMIGEQFRKKFDEEQNAFQKNAIKKDFLFFMQKMDSLQNSAFIGALVSVKNREDLNKIGRYEEIAEVEIMPQPKSKMEQVAEYPGGMNVMRQQVAELFYLEGIKADEKTLKTDVVFMVERDGSISSVHAKGDNFTFNRQAEIALYRLPDKFSPAMIKGNTVRYRFRLPLVMNLE